MSNFDNPPVNPYGNPNNQPAPQNPKTPGAKIASIILWVSSPLIVLLFGCCSTLFLVIGIVPFEEFQQHMDSELQNAPADQVQATEQVMALLQQIHPYMAAFAIAIFLLVVIPALINIVTPFFVIRGGKGATILSILCCFLVLLGLAVLLVASLFIAASNIVLLFPLITAYIIALVYLFRSMKQSPPAEPHNPYASDPWNQHL